MCGTSFPCLTIQAREKKGTESTIKKNKRSPKRMSDDFPKLVMTKPVFQTYREGLVVNMSSHPIYNKPC